jgi:penicillin-binding protein 2
MPKNRFVLKDSAAEYRMFSSRIVIALIFIVFALGLIVARAIYLQVINHEKYITLSENNRLKILPVAPARGFIYDKNGVLLAENRIAYSLEVVPEQAGNLETLLSQLREVITIDDDDIARFKRARQQKRPFDPVTLRHRLTEDDIAKFSVQRYRFPGVDVVSNLSRIYPLGTVGVHALGYVGRISEKEFETLQKNDYLGNDYIGKTGIERFYESDLRGKVGIRQVETNVQGRVVRVLERSPSEPGQNLYLNIDMSFQNYVESLIKDQQAAVVAIEPATGAVLALASMPSYDPNLFVNGIDAATYKELRESPQRPLYNRAVHGSYPPGSTIKPFVGLAGLEYGIRSENSRAVCTGAYRLKGQEHRYRCWRRGGHGSMNLFHAIEQSCDVYFYDLGFDLGIDRLSTFMNRFGFGKLTGIDLKGESSGLMPSREWKRARFKRDWLSGESIITGIGQGYWSATPLQLAVATATLSMRGKYRQPRVVFTVDNANINESDVIHSVPQASITVKDERFWDVVIAGMQAVVQTGTARKVGQGARYHFAGKTGTAQVITIKQNERYDARRIAKKFHDHALFVAFAPIENPQIAIAVVVENGGGGSKTAAPIARKVMDYYLLPRLGLDKKPSKVSPK